MGRPTKYKPEYCEMLIAHMSKGLSLETFAFDINVSVQSIYEWEKAHEEFFEACARARLGSRKFWEQQGIDGLHNGMNANVWSFNMKNRFRWSDRTEIEQQTNVTGSLDLVQLSQAEKLKLLKQQTEELEKLNAIDIG